MNETYVVAISNQDVVLRVSDVSYGQVRVTPSVVGRVQIMGGIPGPAGADGSGGGVQGINLNFLSPSVEWLINHNLGYKPIVELFTTGGVEMQAAVIHTSVNQLLVQFNSPTAGSARLV